MQKFKEWIATENAIRLVNVLFFCSAAVRNGIFNLCAFTVWVFFLGYSIKKTELKVMKLLYALLMIYAAGMVIINVHMLVVLGKPFTLPE